MRISIRFLAILVLVVGGFWAPPSRAGELRSHPSRHPLTPDWGLLREVLRASGISDPGVRQAYEGAFETLAEDLAVGIGKSRSRYHLARKLHTLLHQRVLRRYDSSADGLDSLLDRGEFNCLSASLLYGLLGRAFGLEVQVVEIPRHVYVRLLIDQRRVDVETTSRTGFDLRPKALPGPAFAAEPGYGADAGAAVAPATGIPTHEGVDLERAVGFLWHNAGRRALERGEALRAAMSFLAESRLQPMEAARAETLGMLLARAFRLEYEAGDFEEASQIAEIGLRVFPGQTTARDRLMAAAMKRIESESEAGRSAAAEEILDRATAAAGSPPHNRRLERGACPLIAAAAVREEAWDRAGRMALRFSSAEPDGVESQRLDRWVVRRQREAAGDSERNACTLHPADAPTPTFVAPAQGDATGAVGEQDPVEILEVSTVPTQRH